MTMNAEVKALWLDALRSGEYAQGKNRLVTIYGDVEPETNEFTTNGEVEFCCKGVLCDVAVKQKVELDVRDDADDWYQRSDETDVVRYYVSRQYDGQTGLLPGEVIKWANLYEHVMITDVGTTPFTTKLGIDPAQVDGDYEREWQLGYTDKDGTVKGLDGANDSGVPFAEIANIIEAQF